MNDGLADPGLGEYEIGGDARNEIPPLITDSLQFQLWADGALKYTRRVENTRAFRLPGGDAVSVWHLGDHTLLGTAYGKMSAKVTASGREPAGPPSRSPVEDDI